jgi:holo-[acyl-carrier protein] synthase
MIIGIGNDLAHVDIFVEELLKHDSPFLESTFTLKEMEYCKNSAVPASQSLAARFAAKESFLKAISPLMSKIKSELTIKNINLKDIEIIKKSTGAPQIKLYNHLKKLSESMGILEIWITISHDGNYGLATVILEG